MYPMAKEAAREAEIRELDALLAELFLEAEHINNEYAFFKEKYQFPTVERRVSISNIRNPLITLRFSLFKDKGFNLYGARMGWSKNQGK